MQSHLPADAEPAEAPLRVAAWAAPPFGQPFGQPLGFVDRYALLRCVAEGEVAEVFEAFDPRLDRPVAIKRLRLAGRPDLAARRRLEHERDLLLMLRGQPHVIPLYDSGTVNGCPYLVLPWLAGGSLAERLARAGRLPWWLALPWVAQAAEGLAALHARGWVHHDLKPSNLLLDSQDQLYLSDLGVAAAVGAAAAQPGIWCSPPYVSPERVRGHSGDPRSDVYSLGVVLHELLAGRRPFEGDDVEAVYQAHLEATPPPLPSDVPLPVTAWVDRLLAKAPTGRPADARAVLAEVAALQAGLAGPAAVPLALDPLDRTRIMPAVPPTPRPEPEPPAPAPAPAEAPGWLGPSTWLAVGLAGLIVLGAATASMPVAGPAFWAVVSIVGLTAAARPWTPRSQPLRTHPHQPASGVAPAEQADGQADDQAAVESPSAAGRWFGGLLSRLLGHGLVGAACSLLIGRAMSLPPPLVLSAEPTLALLVAGGAFGAPVGLLTGRLTISSLLAAGGAVAGAFFEAAHTTQVGSWPWAGAVVGAVAGGAVGWLMRQLGLWLVRGAATLALVALGGLVGWSVANDPVDALIGAAVAWVAVGLWHRVRRWWARLALAVAGVVVMGWVGALLSLP